MFPEASRVKQFDVPPTTSREVAEAVLQDPGQRSRLLAYARSRFGIDREEAEDLLQETALELLRQRTLVAKPSGFVFAVFRSRCCRYLADRRMHREVFAGSPEENAAGPGESVPLDSRLALREAFVGISPSCRKVLLAYYVDGASLRDAAQAIALAYSGVWNTISRCLRRLRRCMS